MKYHYQKGIVERDKRGHPKLWLGFFLTFTFITYSGFLFAVLNLNGWPISDISTTAKTVKTTKPTNSKILIPAINVVADGSSLKFKGDPSYSDVTISGSSFGVGFTPSSLREASPLYSLDQLQKGDEVFLDSEGVRYVYQVTDFVDENDQKLTIKSSQKTVFAKTVGTIDWDSGRPRLESF